VVGKGIGNSPKVLDFDGFRGIFGLKWSDFPPNLSILATLGEFSVLFRCFFPQPPLLKDIWGKYVLEFHFTFMIFI